MSEKIEILTILPQDSPFFTVNTSEPAVPLIRPSGSSGETLYAPGAKKTFQAGDNFTILSAGYVLPESFTMSSPRVNGQQTTPALNIFAESTVPAHAGNGWFSQLGQSGIQLPLENYETPLGVFIDIYNTPVNGSFYYLREDPFTLRATLRGLDETGIFRVLFNPTLGLPSPAIKGDVYKATATANGMINGTTYKHNGGTTGTILDWDPYAPGSVFPMVSMIGAPSSLNGKIMRVTVFIKILHTLALS